MKCEDDTNTEILNFLRAGQITIKFCEEYSLLFWVNKMNRTTVCKMLSTRTQEMRSSEVGIIWTDGRVHRIRQHLR
jgi:hypothetical protein